MKCESCWCETFSKNWLWQVWNKLFFRKQLTLECRLLRRDIFNNETKESNTLSSTRLGNLVIRFTWYLLSFFFFYISNFDGLKESITPSAKQIQLVSTICCNVAWTRFFSVCNQLFDVSLQTPPLINYYEKKKDCSAKKVKIKSRRQFVEIKIWRPSWLVRKQNFAMSEREMGRV